MKEPKKLSAQAKASLKYQAKAVKQIKFNFHKTIDADIIEWLESKENRQGYIKSLIRADMEKNK